MSHDTIVIVPRCQLSEREKRARGLCVTPGCPYHAGYDPRVTLCHQCILDEMVREGRGAGRKP